MSDQGTDLLHRTVGCGDLGEADAREQPRAASDAEHAAFMAAVEAGLADIEAGRVHTHAAVREAMAVELPFVGARLIHEGGHPFRCPYSAGRRKRWPPRSRITPSGTISSTVGPASRLSPSTYLRPLTKTSRRAGSA